ncbi:MAG: metallophosphoesterase family protein [Chloroflexi bacterium]|nr:metallophosphoesterase family protein [Chloroflexota bacterium]
MKYLIIADIHSNLEAFEAVLEDAQNHGGFGHTWCLGDVVGYGPDPVACIKLLKQLDPVCVCGNHDSAAVGKIDVGDFSSEAARANRWTAGQLSAEDREFLSGLPDLLVEDDFTIVHGSPRQPVWEYISHSFTAADNFRYFATRFCLVGHTHVPFLFEHDGAEVSGSVLRDGDVLVMGDNRLIINPGSVGQPRDREPRASYLIFDADEMMLRNYRVTYDVTATQEKMERADLPDFLVSRIAWGI